MNLLNAPEFKVGVLVVVISSLIGVMSLKLAEGPGVFGGSKEFTFSVDNASGLVKNSAVKMAGIKVGVIKDIVLEDGRARIHILIDKDVPMTASSKIELKTDGILGDKHVELIPGQVDDPQIESGTALGSADNSKGIDNVMVEVGRVAKQMNQFISNLNKATNGEGDESTPIGRIVKNIERMSADLAQITGRNKEKVNDIIDRLQSLSKNLDTYINEENLARVENAIRNVEEVTEKLNKGEGTLGRLINDDQTVEELNSAISNVNKFLGGADKMEASVDFHSEYLTESDLTKSFLGLKIQPGLDRYYEIQVIDDPKGVKRSTYTETSNNGGPVQTEDKTVTFQNKIKLTALFAKNFYDFTVKGGIIENSGGFGFDYLLLDKKLRFSIELFNFDDLYGRAFVRYNFFRGVYAVAGGDNLFESDDEPASAFIGAGIFITNDDLKMLASKVSF